MNKLFGTNVSIDKTLTIHHAADCSGRSGKTISWANAVKIHARGWGHLVTAYVMVFCKTAVDLFLYLPGTPSYLRAYWPYPWSVPFMQCGNKVESRGQQ